MEKRKQLPGKFVWFEHESHDKKRAQAFYAELFGWKMQPFPMGSYSYDMIYAGDTMIGGWADLKAKGAPARWMACVSVEDVDAAAKAAAANGGRVVDAPMPIPNVGRIARIADPQGAEILLFKSDNGDPEDGCADQGRWAWNELHTTDAYVFVDDTDAIAGRARVRGANIEMPPTDIPTIGRIAVLRDPTGAALAMIKPAPGM